MKTCLIVLVSGLFAAVYAGNEKYHAGFYTSTVCGYQCINNTAPLGCHNVTAHNRKKCQPFTLDGCYDSAKLKILEVVNIDKKNKHKSCAQDCFLWKYYAVSGRYCLCGDQMKEDVAKVDLERCKAPCLGNEMENCASKDLALVYRKQNIKAHAQH